MVRVARIPAESGGDVWEIEGKDGKNLIRLWSSANDARAFALLGQVPYTSTHETTGSLEPLGAIWGLEELAVLVREEGYDGSELAIYVIGPDRLVQAASGVGVGC